MSLDLIMGGAAVFAVVYAYVLRLRLKNAKQRIDTLESKLEHVENVIEDVKSVSDTLANDDERQRLRDKLRASSGKPVLRDVSQSPGS